MSKLVTFVEDIFPHTKGSVVRLEDAELARVDVQIKLRNLDRGYLAGDKSGRGHSNPADMRAEEAVATRAAVRENEVDQSAVLKAQQDAVAEPANVDALGLVGSGETEVVTGTPSVDVDVNNPQAATDVGSGEGVDVAKVDGKKVKK